MCTVRNVYMCINAYVLYGPYMFMCVYVCMNIYMYIYVHICTYVYGKMRVHVYLWMYAVRCTCMCALNAKIYTRVFVFTYAFAC